jgi:protein phosphatase
MQHGVSPWASYEIRCVNSPLEIVMTGCTDTGRVREHNEDAIAWDAPAGLAVLADGMGGHNAGDIASRMAVDDLMTRIAQHCPVDREIDECVRAVRDAVHATNAHIFTTAQRDPGCAQMGTTLALTLFRGRHLLTAHVGDSRVYRLRDGVLSCLTQDHSLVRQLIAEGTMSEDEARRSPYTSVITRALGSHAAVDAEFHEFSVAPGDVYILCSDGLYTIVSEAKLHVSIADANGDWTVAAQQLVALANEGGGRDNISVIVVAVSSSS